MEPKKKRGPKPKYGTTMRIYPIRLPDELVDKARRIGRGVAAEGIRLALEQADVEEK